MPLMRAIRVLNAMEAGTITAAQLDALLSDNARAGEFAVMTAMAGQARRMLASSTTLSVLLSSSKALGALLSTADGRLALWQSDDALAALAGNASAITLMRAHARSSLLPQATTTASTPVAVEGIASPVILLGWSCSGSGIVTLTGRRADSIVGATTASTGSIPGSSASNTNVMALTANVTTANSSASRTHYFQVFMI